MTARESSWTEQDRAEALALTRYREGMCPACGGPMDECTAPEDPKKFWRATFIRCLRRDAMAMAQDAKSDVDRPEALVWSVHMIRR